jgi:hypothetical protein
MNPLPLTVKVALAAPAVTVEGVTELIVGTGLDCACGGVGGGCPTLVPLLLPPPHAQSRQAIAITRITAGTHFGELLRGWFRNIEGVSWVNWGQKAR